MRAIFGKKVGMTQVWDSQSKVVPLTLISVEPNIVNRIKTTDTDGYNAIQIAYGNAPKKINKPDKGQFKDRPTKKHLSEIKVQNTDAYSVGQELNANIFKNGQIVDITGTSKGKGFAGVMKRYNFSGVSASHGAHLNHRKPGSIGACATPGRVFKGIKMAGRMGSDTVTVQNLVINYVDSQKGIIAIKGAVPGNKNSFVRIKSAIKHPESDVEQTNNESNEVKNNG
jgi:large subunit ribosomal protein L3